MKNKIRVLVVDDSAVVRQSLEKLLNTDPGIEVMDTAADPFIAATKIAREIPDVITLDVEMPRMDGVTFLKKIMSQHPIPVVMCSSLAENRCETTLKSLEYGAVDVITKPKMGVKKFLEESRITICDTVKAAARAKIDKVPRARRKKVTKKLTADAVIPAPVGRAMSRTTERIVVVGASTGGTEALRYFLEALPRDSPGIVIVQHMPENFTRAFAQRLNESCDVEVKEAADGDSILRGRALISPGNHHSLVKRSGARYYVEVKQGPLVCRHRPSVDVLFRSAARYGGANVVGVIMTGMGDDGARGMLEMKQAGAYTIAQDEASCVVFGMPNEAIKRGGVDKILPLGAIAGSVLGACAK
ncbi:MAG: chemotaxis response regulator protein-glutamate methylesterase [Desulfobacterales bacterium]|nr:chemotaxis response regulator protein-glutamate methylesterase [Desulfobacterales bacterium]